GFEMKSVRRAANPKSKIPSHAVAIANRQRALRIDQRRLVRMAKSVLTMEKVALADISVAIVGDREIHAINRRFLNHDFPTEAISFPLEDDSARDRPQHGRRKRPGKASSRHRRRGSGKAIAGEVVISAQTARRNAAAYHLPPHDELDLYLVHGLLHL